jgi:plasmid stability protein
MAQLIVRNLNEEVVHQLKMRAARNGRSAEAEHREILYEALMRSQPKKSLKALLLEMPSEFDDAILERVQDRGREIQL